MGGGVVGLGEGGLKWGGWGVATNPALLVAMSLPWQLLQENPDCIFAY